MMSGRDNSAEDDNKSFWSTIPDIIKQIAAVIVAIGVLIGAIHTAFPGWPGHESSTIPNSTQSNSTGQINQLPTIDGAIESNPKSPRPVGGPILITVRATDPENDKIYYKFMIKGPKDEEYKPQTGWTTDNEWKWTPTEDQVGNNEIRVYVRDEKHSIKINEGDDQADMNFKITETSVDMNLGDRHTESTPVNITLGPGGRTFNEIYG